VYDNFSSGTDAHLAAVAVSPRLSIVRADVKDLDTLTKAMAGADQVWHFASNPDIAKAVTNPDVDFWEGTYLTNNVLEAMRRAGVADIVYASGSGVYGDTGLTETGEDYSPLRPISTYGASKLAGEMLICSYCHMFGMRGRAYRFANVVGPRQTHGVGFDFIRRLVKGPKQLSILGDGTQSKSYIYVDDVLEAMHHTAPYASTPFDVYNVATGDYITVAEIADLAVEAAGLSPGSVRYDYTGGDRGWKGDVPVVRFDLSKIHATGWKARNGSGEALKLAMRAMIKEVSEN
jgi:UDP-glucose 4-epimerase